MQRWLGLVVLGCVPGLFAQNLGFQAPVSGFVFEHSMNRVRALSGIAGSAILGDVVLDRVQAASLSRDGDSAIVKRGDNLFAVAGLKSDGLAWRDLHLSGDSTYAVGWSGANALIALGGRLYDISSSVSMDLGELQVRSLTWNSSTKQVWVAANGGVYGGRSDEGALQLLVPLANPVGLVTSSSGDVFVADGDTGDIYRGLEKFALAPVDGSRIVGLALSADGRRLYAADLALSKLWVYDAATGEHRNDIDLSFAPDRLEPVSGRRWFVLNGGDGPLFLLEDGTAPRVFFVPASRPEMVTGQ